jgi:hypothetical protein
MFAKTVSKDPKHIRDQRHGQVGFPISLYMSLPGLFDDRAVQATAAKEAAWEQEREELYAEIGRLSTQLSWLKKKGGRGLES